MNEPSTEQGCGAGDEATLDLLDPESKTFRCPELEPEPEI